jgi:hypothetical protein
LLDSDRARSECDRRDARRRSDVGDARRAVDEDRDARRCTDATRKPSIVSIRTGYVLAVDRKSDGATSARQIADVVVSKGRTSPVIAQLTGDPSWIVRQGHQGRSVPGAREGGA